MRVLFAPDSFKGSIDAVDAAAALIEGWAAVRDGDDLVSMPQADGGEGTLDVLAACSPGSTWSSVRGVCGPDGRQVDARWLMLDNGRAVIELAESSGIAIMESLNALAATTRGLGEVIRGCGSDRISVALGGSASTDGGLGVLRALGVRVLDESGRDVPEGGAGLVAARSVDASGLVGVPSDIELLTDTRAVLFGPDGAAHVFGPQKGASAADIEVLDGALQRWAELLTAAGLPADPYMPGTGAAGGVGFGLCALGARVSGGAERVSELTGLSAAVPAADLVVTGEGMFDRTSLTGKLVGHVVQMCSDASIPVAVVAGAVNSDVEVRTVSLTDLAGSGEAAIADARRWLIEAGRRLAKEVQIV
ncbi:glycerate kinase [Rhodococcus fascians]|nr:glycerate kinase [Rhodococcus fascians]MBY3996284.1 glycerate kinase [Rhodococcus fascians]MBY4003001.1 glycerate kinase [Rhodococcus fascians]MBY4007751.1 glycerate kinase [Rhodococcus fascians]MBY4017496.1 glycerate kinase [Rhodococcus fascians]